MTMKRWDGAAFVDLSIAKRWNGSAMVDLTIAKRWDGAAWVDITLPGGGGGALSAVSSPSYVEALYFAPSGSSARSLSTGNTTATASGGSGAGPTYLWQQISGDSGITASAPNSATTYFSSTLSKNSTRDAVWRCTVTRGTDTVYVYVTVHFEYYVGIIP